MKYLKTTLVGVLSIIALGTNAQCVVASYSFSGNANDSSGNGYHANVTHAQLTKDRFDNANAAYYFNGDSSYIEVPNSKSMITGKFSVSAWLYIDSVKNQNVIGKADDHTGKYSLYQDLAFAATSTGELSAHVTATSGTPYAVKSVLSSKYPTQKWCHIVMTWDNDTLKTYFNGQLTDVNVRQNSFMLSARFNLSFGGSSALNNIKPDRFFQGKIDDVVIYTCEIDPSTIDSLYHVGGFASVKDFANAESSTSLRIYPIPSSGDITVSSEMPLVKLVLLDVTGKMVQCISVHGEGEVILTSLEPGIYFVQVLNANNAILTKKVVVE